MNDSPDGCHSCFYEGVVRHRRHLPVPHEFQYRLFMVYLDLEELPRLLGGAGLWSSRWPALARFRRSDHLGDPRLPLDACVRAAVAAEVGFTPAGPIRLLTNLRYFGFLMNPVSFYYCFDAQGERVEALVAEVHNTPWNERHCYVLDTRDAQFGRPLAAEHDKVFHVSPFLPIEMRYRWRLTVPGEALRVHIQNLAESKRPFDATLSLERRPWSAWQRLRLLTRYPFMTGQVFAGIYWQALRLWWRGIPYVPHPGSLRSSADPSSKVISS